MVLDQVDQRFQKITHTAHLAVSEEHLEKFRERLLQHAAASLKEEGCPAFSIYQSTDLPTSFLLIEEYLDGPSLDAHRMSAHFLAFRQDVADWVLKRDWWYWRALTP